MPIQKEKIEEVFIEGRCRRCLRHITRLYSGYGGRKKIIIV